MTTLHLSAESTAVAEEALRGLTATPKSLSPWLFYDEAGSQLFERITELPEYYLTRTERSILGAHAEEIIAQAAGGKHLDIWELGAGTASKTGLLLRAAVNQQSEVLYHPIDVSETALAVASRQIEQSLPGVHVLPQVADYTHSFALPAAAPGHRRLVLYIGSSIGNFSPEDALVLLKQVRSQLLPGDALLLGTDLVKEEATLLAAYDDAAGVTAAFNRNILRRLNRELGADFHAERFAHRAQWNAAASRIEIYLESLERQRVHLPALGMDVEFAAGETIHTENSYKFTVAGVKQLLDRAGFQLQHTWMDRRNWFGVHLAYAK
ncbi:MAG: L-histidine N(alpha)-methyltransferase [Acidobacteriaceae bacterium]